MTVSHAGSPLPTRSVEHAVGTLRHRGLRASAARRLVLEALFAADRPVTAEEIADGVHGRVPRSDLASAYRNLETLESVGLVRHVHLGHGPGLYALAATGDRDYLLCDSCGHWEAVAPDVLEPARAAIEAATGHRARFSHFPIVGRCAGCADPEPAA
jgi:Fur family ferric uptake transcriptional regulator